MVWEVLGKKIKLVEVQYVGTHERQSPASREGSEWIPQPYLMWQERQMAEPSSWA